MKILHLIDTLRRGGKERQFVELIRGLNKPNYQIHTIVLEQRKDGYDEEVRGLSYNFEYKFRRFRWDIFLIIDFVKYCRKHKIEVMQVWDGMSAFYAYFVSFFTGIKFINYSIQEADPRLSYRHIIQRIILKLSRYVIANQYAGLKVCGVEKKGKVIYNGLDLKRFDNLKKQKTDKFVIGIVANLTDYKDYYTFFNAIKIISEIRNDFEVQIIGWGKFAEAYKQYAEKLGIMNHLKFLGSLSNVEECVINFDVGVLSSYKDKGEGLSNSVLEYMACGIPPIITDIGAAREIVEEGVTGLLFEAGNAKDLANKIKLMIEDRAMRIEIGERAREVVFERFSYERYIREMEEYYERVIIG